MSIKDSVMFVFQKLMRKRVSKMSVAVDKPMYILYDNYAKNAGRTKVFRTKSSLNAFKKTNKNLFNKNRPVLAVKQIVPLINRSDPSSKPVVAVLMYSNLDKYYLIGNKIHADTGSCLRWLSAKHPKIGLSAVLCEMID
jgi:hypothetical protein